ncbi:MAG TPA: carboxypeptidase-like regulatory domain-containing protein, partial [Blastocatellia bacterium]|nr:carboxypeptidase-like regulatory domain-containing protein [Blastocatellia bacterium]
MGLQRYLAALFCLLFPTVFANAQPVAISPVEGSELAGVVRDSTGASVPQATVTLLNARQSVVASTTTDGQGRFVLKGAPAGTYELRVTSGRGFSSRSKAVRVSPTPEAENSRIEITLGVESLTAEVTITADVGVVQSLDQ